MPPAEHTLTVASVLMAGGPMPVTAKLSLLFYEKLGE
jgi:hypothetical protein